MYRHVPHAVTLLRVLSLSFHPSPSLPSLTYIYPGKSQLSTFLTLLHWLPQFSRPYMHGSWSRWSLRAVLKGTSAGIVKGAESITHSIPDKRNFNLWVRILLTSELRQDCEHCQHLFRWQESVSVTEPTARFCKTTATSRTHPLARELTCLAWKSKETQACHVLLWQDK